MPLASISPSTVLAVRAVDQAGRAALVRPSVARDPLVELIAPKFVSPYRLIGKRGKASCRDVRYIVKDGSLREPNGIAFA